MIYRAIGFLSIFLITGCATGYKEYYRPAPNVTPEMIAARRAGPPPVTPLLERVPVANQELFNNLARRGFLPIGHSSFNAGREHPESMAIEQAKAVGADLVVIIDPKYTGTITSAVPITTPSTATVITGNMVSRVYGTSTTMMPISTVRQDYGAAYFVKAKFQLGFVTHDLNDAQRKELQTNKGVVVTQIVNDTPAYEADLLVGDVIKSVNGRPIDNVEKLGVYIKENQNIPYVFSIHRNGQLIEKTISAIK